jgi:hypothetical protein
MFYSTGCLIPPLPYFRTSLLEKIFQEIVLLKIKRSQLWITLRYLETCVLVTHNLLSHSHLYHGRRRTVFGYFFQLRKEKNVHQKENNEEINL